MKFPGLANLTGALIFIFCFSLFAFQLFGLLRSWVSPTTTNTFVEEVPLDSIDFPLEIIICVRPGLNATALQNLGYDEAFAFAVGASKFDYSLVGWGGHDDEGKSLKTAKEVLDLVKPTWSKELPVFNHTNNYQSRHGLKLNMINWLDDCHTLNLADIEDNGEGYDGLKAVTIAFTPLLMKDIVENNITLELKLLDKNLLVNRKIEQLSFYYNGNTMVMKNSFSNYIVKIKKNVFVEEDPRKTCRIYPNAEFSSYAECDDQFMRDRIDQVAPGMNITPPWLTKDLDKVTTEPVVAPIDYGIVTGFGNPMILSCNRMGTFDPPPLPLVIYLKKNYLKNRD